MKKLILGAAVFAAGLFSTANAQIQEGNWMVGGHVADMNFASGTKINIAPSAGYFVKDNWAVGAKVALEINSPKGSSDTQTNWTLTPFTRYYFGQNEIDGLLNNGRFFGEAAFGFGGDNSNTGNSANGVKYQFGAGYSYFINRNVALEGMLNFGTITGVGTKGNVGLNFGFQIFLPSAKVKAALKDQ
ncbi:outer membrane beta-barrel protein [Riemerella columbina]|uniref:outer membrane beta-barrel protein n=1 Tax=Riemerella columbina TaxID=103810 RepID=UPI0003716471|nr:outer membrane beta-barrel protein [Riemerella columbina]